MTDDVTSATAAQISRRTMIGGTAGAVAAVWAVPAIMSFGGSAGAASVTCQPGRACDVGFVQCGASGTQDFCFCDAGIGGGATICSEDFQCGDPAHPACASDADCPNGWICSAAGCTGCDDSSGFCAAPCGSNIASTTRVKSSGGRNSHR
jgi:hypothetical protein